jgi:hypothetical protein
VIGERGGEVLDVGGRRDQHRALERQAASVRDQRRRRAQRVADHCARTERARDASDVLGEVGEVRVATQRVAVRGLIERDHAISGGEQARYERDHLRRAATEAVREQRHRTLARAPLIEGQLVRTRAQRGALGLIASDLGHARRDHGRRLPEAQRSIPCSNIRPNGRANFRLNESGRSHVRLLG